MDKSGEAPDHATEVDATIRYRRESKTLSSACNELAPEEENVRPKYVPLITFMRSVESSISVTVDQSDLPDTLDIYERMTLLSKCFPSGRRTLK